MRSPGSVCVLAVLSIAVVWASPLTAQAPASHPATPPPPGLLEIRDAVQRIATALERQTLKQDLDLQLKALDLRMRRLGDVEQQLHGEQEKRRELESERVGLEVKTKRFVRRNEAKDLGLSKSEVDDAADEMQARVRELKEQVSELDQGIALLENEVASRRIEIDQGLQQLDRRIDQRQ